MNRLVAPPLLALALLLNGCATIRREPFGRAEQAAATIPGMVDVRFWADDPGAASRMTPPLAPPGGRTMLALSSGGDDGPFAAGFLTGWSRMGTRPEFTAVTGVSTGALLAPFAFLGPAWDGQMTYVFTHIDQKNVMRLRFPLAIPGSTSIASTEPLERLIARNVTDGVVDAVAAQHRRGRRLFVETTNLDAQRAVVWDLGAIAASGALDRYALFRRVLLASSSLPGIFPPVPIDAVVDGRVIRELHVDGGVVAQILTPPPARDALPDTQRGSRLYMIASSKMGGDFRLVNPRTVPVLRSAYGLALQSALASQIAEAFLAARYRGMDARLAYIGSEFAAAAHPMFATWYLKRMYAYGYDQGLKGAWVGHAPDATDLFPPQEPSP